MADELFDGRLIRVLTIVDHVSRESVALEVGQSTVPVGRCQAADVLIDPRRVGPVGLDRNKSTTPPLDEFLRDLNPHAVKLGGSVRSLTDQHQPAIAHAFDE